MNDWGRLHHQYIALYKQYLEAPLEFKALTLYQFNQHARQMYTVKSPQQLAYAQNYGDLYERLQQAIEEETSSIPTTQKLNQAELDEVTHRMSRRVKEAMRNQLVIDTQRVYDAGRGAAMQEVGYAPTPISPHQAEVVQRIAGNEVVRQAFDGLGEDLQESFKQYIIDEYKRGTLDRQRLRNHMLNHVAWENHQRIERIADTEAWKAHTTGRMAGYAEAEARRGEKFKYRFGTIRDKKTCTVCTNIIRRTWDEGATMKELNDVIIEEAAKHNPKWNPIGGGGWPMPHIGCRHGVYRLVEVNNDN